MTLQYSWTEGLESNVIFTLVDSSGMKVSILEKHIGTEASKGVDKLVSNSTLQTGVWKILVQSDSKEIAELQFLVLPLLVSAGPSTGKDVKQNLLERIDELTAQFWRAEGLCSLEDIWSQCPNIEQCTYSEWSSMSPDPKSDITMIDNENKSSK